MKGSLLKTNLLLLVALWGFCGVLGQTIDATGGGIVKLGDKLSLSLKGDKDWQTCKWVHAKTNSKCDLKKDPVKGVVITCTSVLANRASVLKTEDTKVCGLEIDKTVPADEGTWAGSMDGAPLINIDVVLAEKTKSVKAEAANLVEGKPGVLNCVVFGGKPAPHLAYDYKPKAHPGLKEVTGTVTSKVDSSNNDLKTTYSLEVVADRSANGLLFNCQVIQLDKKNESLYTVMDSNDGLIQVTYGPALLHGTNYTTIEGVKLDQTNIVHFAIDGNPKPDVSLTITTPQKAGELKLNLGDKDGRYTLGTLIKPAKSPYYNLTFTIDKMIPGDLDKVYTLEVTNSVSKLSNQFKFKVGGSTNKPPTSTRTIVIIVVVALVVALILLVACVLTMKKCKSRSNETTPLR